MAAQTSTSDCLASILAPNGPWPPLTVSGAMDGGGNLLGLPSLMAPLDVSAEVRRGYISLVAALDQCAPYADAAGAEQFVASIEATGAIAFVPQGQTQTAEAPAVAAAPETPTAQIPVFTFEQPDTAVAEAPQAPAPAPSATPLPLFSIAEAPPPATEADERALDLDRATIGDLQARLLVSGFDPNGIDGRVGGGTRSAIRAWQEAEGIEATGYVNEAQLTLLAGKSQPALDAWLQDPENASVYEAASTAPAARKKRQVRVCKRNALGLLYDCRMVWR